jgi:hypothetical protein
VIRTGYKVTNTILFLSSYAPNLITFKMYLAMSLFEFKLLTESSDELYERYSQCNYDFFQMTENEFTTDYSALCDDDPYAEPRVQNMDYHDAISVMEEVVERPRPIFETVDLYDSDNDDEDIDLETPRFLTPKFYESDSEDETEINQLTNCPDAGLVSTKDFWQLEGSPMIKVMKDKEDKNELVDSQNGSANVTEAENQMELQTVHSNKMAPAINVTQSLRQGKKKIFQIQNKFVKN